MFILVIWGETHEPERFQERIAWLDKQVKDVKKWKKRDSTILIKLNDSYELFSHDIIKLLNSKDIEDGELIRGDSTMRWRTTWGGGIINQSKDVLHGES